MLPKQRALLRLHIEAVWGIQLPPLINNNVELLSAGVQPTWKLYYAEINGEQLAIWRPDVPQAEREALLTRASAALQLSPTTPARNSQSSWRGRGPVHAPLHRCGQMHGRAPHHRARDLAIKREVVLHQEALPTISTEIAHEVARPLTPGEQALVESFDPGRVDYYYHSHRQPLIGVIVAGRLLCLAHSSRRTSSACELGIDTLAEGRRKGYALAATVLWAAAVAQEGLLPLYSASADNVASLALAATAGYRAFARAATIDG